MKYAILAAGEGSRLQQEGINVPKPLVKVGGETLLERLIRIFVQCGADDIVVVCNDLHPEVNDTLLRLEKEGMDGRPLPLRHVVQTTPSSMHSMYALRELLRGGKFILTTVDTYFSEQAFARYVEAFEQTDADGMMGVTDFVDDEKPLYVQTTDDLHITDFLDAEPEHACTYISAGIYGLSDGALTTLERCIASGQSRMRNFQRALIADGLRLEAWPLGRVTDIDHASDIPRTVVGIARARVFSPGSADNDEAIMNETLGVLADNGYATRLVNEEEVAEALPAADMYLNMGRMKATLDMLRRASTPMLNIPAAVELCTRRVYAEPYACGVMHTPQWLKRTDTCATTEGDVVYCHTVEEVEQATLDMMRRGAHPDSLLHMPHYDGDTVKFYGVLGSDFFHICHAQAGSVDKFGRVLPSPIGLHFDEQRLRTMATQMATLMCCDVYGGDAVITPGGVIHIVDLNDWPSFSPCRTMAARAIAERVMHSSLLTPHCEPIPHSSLRSHSSLLTPHSSLQRAIAFDYGATLDTRGEHWSKVLYRAYEHEHVPVTWQQFWEAYKRTERWLGNEPVISPTTSFLSTLTIKIHKQFGLLAEAGALTDEWAGNHVLQNRIAEHAYQETLEVTQASRQMLADLQRQGKPMVLVSNFYGNIRTVLREFGLEGFFSKVIESAEVGIRKPDPRLWQLAIDALTDIVPGLQPSDILVVGDSLEKDILPAQSLGCQTYHVYN